MVIFDFEGEETGTKQNVCYLVYFLACNITGKFQLHCFITGGDILNFVSHHCTFTADEVISD